MCTAVEILMREIMISKRGDGIVQVFFRGQKGGLNCTGTRTAKRGEVRCYISLQDLSETIDEHELRLLICANYAVAGLMRDHEIDKKVERV